MSVKGPQSAVPQHRQMDKIDPEKLSPEAKQAYLDSQAYFATLEDLQEARSTLAERVKPLPTTQADGKEEKDTSLLSKAKKAWDSAWNPKDLPRNTFDGDLPEPFEPTESNIKSFIKDYGEYTNLDLQMDGGKLKVVRSNKDMTYSLRKLWNPNTENKSVAQGKQKESRECYVNLLNRFSDKPDLVDAIHATKWGQAILKDKDPLVNEMKEIHKKQLDNLHKDLADAPKDPTDEKYPVLSRLGIKWEDKIYAQTSAAVEKLLKDASILAMSPINEHRQTAQNILAYCEGNPKIKPLIEQSPELQTLLKTAKEVQENAPEESKIQKLTDQWHESRVSTFSKMAKAKPSSKYLIEVLTYPPRARLYGIEDAAASIGNPHFTQEKFGQNPLEATQHIFKTIHFHWERMSTYQRQNALELIDKIKATHPELANEAMKTTANNTPILKAIKNQAKGATQNGVETYKKLLSELEKLVEKPVLPNNTSYSNLLVLRKHKKAHEILEKLENNEVAQSIIKEDANLHRRVNTVRSKTKGDFHAELKACDARFADACLEEIEKLGSESNDLKIPKGFSAFKQVDHVKPGALDVSSRKQPVLTYVTEGIALGVTGNHWVNRVVNLRNTLFENSKHSLSQFGPTTTSKEVSSAYKEHQDTIQNVIVSSMKGKSPEQQLNLALFFAEVGASSVKLDDYHSAEAILTTLNSLKEQIPNVYANLRVNGHFEALREVFENKENLHHRLLSKKNVLPPRSFIDVLGKKGQMHAKFSQWTGEARAWVNTTRFKGTVDLTNIVGAKTAPLKLTKKMELKNAELPSLKSNPKSVKDIQIEIAEVEGEFAERIADMEDATDLTAETRIEFIGRDQTIEQLASLYKELHSVANQTGKNPNFRELAEKKTGEIESENGYNPLEDCESHIEEIKNALADEDAEIATINQLELDLVAAYKSRYHISNGKKMDETNLDYQCRLEASKVAQEESGFSYDELIENENEKIVDLYKRSKMKGVNLEQEVIGPYEAIVEKICIYGELAGKESVKLLPFKDELKIDEIRGKGRDLAMAQMKAPRAKKKAR